MRPAIVDEIVRTDTLTEVQPIITRHVEQPYINHIESHIYQPAAPLAVSTVTNAPVINEVIHPHIINEVQEIIHQEVPVVQVQKVEEFTEESIVLPTEYTSETQVMGTDFTGNLNQADQDARLAKDLERMNLDTRQQGMQAGGNAQL